MNVLCLAFGQHNFFSESMSFFTRKYFHYSRMEKKENKKGHTIEFNSGFDKNYLLK